MTLTAFLLARIAEDGVVARRALRAYQHVFGIPHWFTANSDTSVAMNPRVALAECAAKRRIVESCRADHEDALTSGDDTTALATEILYHLAAIYADHPDCREEWKS